MVEQQKAAAHPSAKHHLTFSQHYGIFVPSILVIPTRVNPILETHRTPKMFATKIIVGQLQEIDFYRVFLCKNDEYNSGIESLKQD